MNNTNEKQSEQMMVMMIANEQENKLKTDTTTYTMLPKEEMVTVQYCVHSCTSLQIQMKVH